MSGRILGIGLGLLVIAFRASPAGANSYADNTANMMFAVFSDFGGFGGGEIELYSENDYEEHTVLILNLANVIGLFPPEGTLNLDFGVFIGVPFLTGREYFGIGSFSNPLFSDHLLLTADAGAVPHPLGEEFEAMIVRGAMNMDALNAALLLPGGMAFVSLSAFAAHFGVPINTFVVPGSGEIGWDTVTLFVGRGENEIHGFPIPPIFIGTLTLIQNGTLTGQFRPAPEPTLGALALLALAGVGLTRRRRAAA